MLRVAGRYFLLLTLLVHSPVFANHESGAAHATTQVSAASKRDAAYARQEKAIAQAYRQYKKKVAKVWGREAIVPDAKRDVTYRDNLRERSIIDFSKGMVKVEVVLPPAHAENREKAVERLGQAIGQTLAQGPDERSIVEIAKHPEPPPTPSIAVLADLIANDDGTPFAPRELEDFMAEKAQELKMHALKGQDGQRRVVVSTQFKMVPDHIRVRAEKFSDSVERYAREHDIPAPVIYAIIETESSFNPRARSPIPAFGLMQLVPSRAARDAYKFLHAKDRVVNERYLYVADKNIELGTTYLHILYHRYFKKIKDPESRQWAAIAAYNAGARNVIKAFAGKYRKSKFGSSFAWKRYAFDKINKMTPSQVYKHLRRRMPAGETRRYIKKVRGRMAKYSA